MNKTTNKKFQYPWNGLEASLESSGTSELTLLAYGSLMNKKSARLTLPIAPDAEFVPAIAHGVKRVFDYRLAVESYARHGVPESDRHIAALNVVYTAKEDDSVNGLLVRIPTKKIDSLRQREVGYDLIQISAKHWETRQDLSEPVFVLECKRNDSSILPHLNYLKICEDGARAISDSFLDFFRTTTFLADKTCLAEWNRDTNV